MSASRLDLNNQDNQDSNIKERVEEKLTESVDWNVKDSEILQHPKNHATSTNVCSNYANTNLKPFNAPTGTDVNCNSLTTKVENEANKIAFQKAAQDVDVAKAITRSGQSLLNNTTSFSIADTQPNQLQQQQKEESQENFTTTTRNNGKQQHQQIPKQEAWSKQLNHGLLQLMKLPTSNINTQLENKNVDEQQKFNNYNDNNKAKQRVNNQTFDNTTQQEAKEVKGALNFEPINTIQIQRQIPKLITAQSVTNTSSNNNNENLNNNNIATLNYYLKTSQTVSIEQVELRQSESVHQTNNQRSFESIQSDLNADQLLTQASNSLSDRDLESTKAKPIGCYATSNRSINYSNGNNVHNNNTLVPILQQEGTKQRQIELLQVGSGTIKNSGVHENKYNTEQQLHHPSKGQSNFDRDQLVFSPKSGSNTDSEQQQYQALTEDLHHLSANKRNNDNSSDIQTSHELDKNFKLNSKGSHDNENNDINGSSCSRSCVSSIQNSSAILVGQDNDYQQRKRCNNASILDSSSNLDVSVPSATTKTPTTIHELNSKSCSKRHQKVGLAQLCAPLTPAISDIIRVTGDLAEEGSTKRDSIQSSAAENFTTNSTTTTSLSNSDSHLYIKLRRMQLWTQEAAETTNNMLKDRDEYLKLEQQHNHNSTSNINNINNNNIHISFNNNSEDEIKSPVFQSRSKNAATSKNCNQDTANCVESGLKSITTRKHSILENYNNNHYISSNDYYKHQNNIIDINSNLKSTSPVDNITEIQNQSTQNQSDHRVSDPIDISNSNRFAISSMRANFNEQSRLSDNINNIGNQFKNHNGSPKVLTSLVETPITNNTWCFPTHPLDQVVTKKEPVPRPRANPRNVSSQSISLMSANSSSSLSNSSSNSTFESSISSCKPDKSYTRNLPLNEQLSILTNYNQTKTVNNNSSITSGHNESVSSPPISTMSDSTTLFTEADMMNSSELIPKLIQRLDRKLIVMKEEQVALMREIETNELNGQRLFESMKHLLTVNEYDKINMQANEIEKVTKLILSLKLRLKRVENSLKENMQQQQRLIMSQSNDIAAVTNQIRTQGELIENQDNRTADEHSTFVSNRYVCDANRSTIEPPSLKIAQKDCCSLIGSTNKSLNGNLKASSTNQRGISDPTSTVGLPKRSHQHHASLQAVPSESVSHAGHSVTVCIGHSPNGCRQEICQNRANNTKSSSTKNTSISSDSIFNCSDSAIGSTIAGHGGSGNMEQPTISQSSLVSSTSSISSGSHNTSSITNSETRHKIGSLIRDEEQEITSSTIHIPSPSQSQSYPSSMFAVSTHSNSPILSSTSTSTPSSPSLVSPTTTSDPNSKQPNNILECRDIATSSKDISDPNINSSNQDFSSDGLMSKDYQSERTVTNVSSGLIAITPVVSAKPSIDSDILMAQRNKLVAQLEDAHQLEENITRRNNVIIQKILKKYYEETTNQDGAIAEFRQFTRLKSLLLKDSHDIADRISNAELQLTELRQASAANDNNLDTKSKSHIVLS